METFVRIFAVICLLFVWGVVVGYTWPELLDNKTFMAVASLVMSILFWSWVNQRLRGKGGKRVPDRRIWGWPWQR